MLLLEQTVLNEYFNYICLEKTLSSAERKKLSDFDFGLPEERKFPIHDKAHVLKAIQFFRYCPGNKKKELAKNIKTAADKVGVEISDKSLVHKYL